ncbi:helix-turn-helix domain-containing protein [Lentzea sp. JNUCC 0626]|uniref:helix-turn-helix domain-containing protein n=1 Tax=Lentzea sp. JNUCC 0626 TaxID=3367513 RepID=UPI00374A35A5
MGVAVGEHAVREARRREPTASFLVVEAGHVPGDGAQCWERPAVADVVVVGVCVTGRGVLRAGDMPLGLHSGTAFVLPSGTPQSYRGDPRDPWSIWWLHVTGRLTAALLSVVVPEGGPKVVSIDDPYRTAWTMRDVLRTLEQDESHPALVEASASSWELLSGLAGRPARAGGRAGPGEVVRAHIDAHLDRPLKVTELARMVNLSESRFSAVFRMTTGMSVTAYVKQQRMLRARELLRTSSHLVTDIAALVGYTDPHYFSRQFHAMHGHSPTAYRLQVAPAGSSGEPDSPGTPTLAPTPSPGM